jgi:4-diphosphocytidyl-2-C-methyl-D-erythritol kinase
MSMQPLLIDAPAKVNLTLYITGRRTDGYHLLDSVVGFTEFGDVVECAPAPNLTLTMAGDFSSALSTHDNLVLRAAHLLQAYTGCTKGAHITLHKHIPVGAGLGGGSSDAAATLRGLQRLWDLDIDATALDTIALQLGSDVPVCLRQQYCRMQGVGEIITPLPLPQGWSDWGVVLVNPGMPLLTKDVFRRFSDNAQENTLENALQAPAIALMPVIADVVSAIEHTPSCHVARMSGSGATCFGLYKDVQSATSAAIHIKQNHPAWWVQQTRFKYG